MKLKDELKIAKDYIATARKHNKGEASDREYIDKMNKWESLWKQPINELDMLCKDLIIDCMARDLPDETIIKVLKDAGVLKEEE